MTVQGRPVNRRSAAGVQAEMHQSEHHRGPAINRLGRVDLNHWPPERYGPGGIVSALRPEAQEVLWARVKVMDPAWYRRNGHIRERINTGEPYTLSDLEGIDLAPDDPEGRKPAPMATLLNEAAALVALLRLQMQREAIKDWQTWDADDQVLGDAVAKLDGAVAVVKRRATAGLPLPDVAATGELQGWANEPPGGIGPERMRALAPHGWIIVCVDSGMTASTPDNAPEGYCDITGIELHGVDASDVGAIEAEAQDYYVKDVVSRVPNGEVIGLVKWSPPTEHERGRLALEFNWGVGGQPVYRPL